MRPLKSAFLAGHHNDAYILLSVGLNPDLLEEKQNRSQLALSFVIDRSGSMRGGRLEQAKIAFRKALDLLKADDEVNLVVYHNTVNQALNHMRVDQALMEIDPILSDIEAGGSTNLAGGLLKGGELLTALEGGKQLVKRVMLLSDGQANVGISSINGLSEIAAKLANQDQVSTSTYGIGEGFNEDIMSAIAAAGQGVGYFGELASDLLDPFTRDIDMLANGYARSVQLRFQTRPDVKLQVMNDYTMTEDVYQLPSISFGTQTWAMIKVTISSEQLGNPEPLFTAFVDAVEIKSEKEIQAYSSFAPLPILGAEAYETVTKDPELVKILSEVKLVEQRKVLREAALNGDWERVDLLIQQLENEDDQSEWRERLVYELKEISRRRDRQRFSKEMHYSSKMISEMQLEDREQVEKLARQQNISSQEYLSSRRVLNKKSSSGKGNW